jgi:hypothetical protein
MSLAKYSKPELKKIVDIYNIGLDMSSLKKKKAELIKDMMGVKKSYDFDDIDRKLKKKAKTVTERKKKLKVVGKAVLFPEARKIRVKRK